MPGGVGVDEDRRTAGPPERATGQIGEGEAEAVEDGNVDRQRRCPAPLALVEQASQGRLVQLRPAGAFPTGSDHRGRVVEEGRVVGLDRDLIEGAVTTPGEKTEASVHNRAVEAPAGHDLPVEAHAHRGSFEGDPQRVIGTSNERPGDRVVDLPASLRAVVSNDDPSPWNVDGHELEVIGRVLVEDEAADVSGAERGVEFKVGGELQPVPEAEIDEVECRVASGVWGARVAAVGHDLPRAGRGTGEQVGAPVDEVLGVLEGDLRRQHLHGDEVEAPLRVIGAGSHQAGVEAVRPAVDDPGIEDMGEGRFAVEQDGHRGAVDGDEHLIVDIGLGLALRLHVDDPTFRRAPTHLDLVGGDVDAGELEVIGGVVVEHDVGVGLPAPPRLLGLDPGLDLVVGGQVVVEIEDRRRVAAERGRRNVECPATHRPHAAVGSERGDGAVVEVGGTQHVPSPAEVARLRVGGPARLVLPEAPVARGHQTQLTVRLPVAVRIVPGVGGPGRVGAVALRQGVQEPVEARRHLTAMRSSIYWRSSPHSRCT